MEKRLEYYCRKINKSITANNKLEAEMYYQKALKNIGDNQEILSFKSQIDKIEELEHINKNQESTSENSKTVKSNEGLITLIAVLLAFVMLVAYIYSSIIPKYSLYKKLNHMWYIGDVSTSHSDGLVLEFEFKENYAFEIIYRHRKDSPYTPICIFNGKALGSNKISVDGQTVTVDFNAENNTISFKPSFVSLEKISTWKMYDIGMRGNEPFVPPVDTTVNKSSSYSEEKSEPKKDCSNGHSWQDITDTIHHKEEGHYENVEVDFKSVEKYHCSSSDCENTPWYYSYDELSRHYQNVHGYTVSRDQMISMCYTSYDQKPVYEKKWIVDKEAYDETVVKGQKCSVCGETK